MLSLMFTLALDFRCPLCSSQSGPVTFKWTNTSVIPIRGPASPILPLFALLFQFHIPGKAILGLRNLVSLYFCTGFILLHPPHACKLAAAAPALKSSQLWIHWKAKVLASNDRTHVLGLTPAGQHWVVDSF